MPIYDLLQRFSLVAKPNTKQTVVVVLNRETEQGGRSVGVVVNTVLDAMIAADSQIASTPEFTNVVMG